MAERKRFSSNLGRYTKRVPIVAVVMRERQPKAWNHGITVSRVISEIGIAVGCLEKEVKVFIN